MRLKSGILYSLSFLCILVFPDTGRGEETIRSRFSFIVIGDTPYENQDYVDIDNILQSISKSDARFVVHIGDYKAEESPCSSKYDQIAVDFFKNMNKPVILTPGDNDWTDCEDKTARLETIRKKFFESPDYKTIDDITNQSTVSREFRKFIENSTWSINGVRFVTVHVVGENNNRPYSGYRWDHKNTLFDKISRNLFADTVFADTIFKDYFSAENIEYGDMEEFTLRERANLDWLQYALSMAKENNDSALVIMNHANVLRGRLRHLRSGYDKFIEEVRTIAREFKKPILWIQGSSHVFRIDRPFTYYSTIDVPYGEEVNLVSRIIVPGSPMNSFVTIDVDPNTDDIFHISVEFLPAVESSVR